LRLLKDRPQVAEDAAVRVDRQKARQQEDELLKPLFPYPPTAES